MTNKDVIAFLSVYSERKEGKAGYAISLRILKTDSPLHTLPHSLTQFSDLYAGLHQDQTLPKLKGARWRISRDMEWLMIERQFLIDGDILSALTVYHIVTTNGQTLEFQKGGFDVNTAIIDGLVENRIAWITTSSNAVCSTSAIEYPWLDRSER